MREGERERTKEGERESKKERERERVRKRERERERPATSDPNTQGERSRRGTHPLRWPKRPLNTAKKKGGKRAKIQNTSPVMADTPTKTWKKKERKKGTTVENVPCHGRHVHSTIVYMSIQQ